jgi:hypothetical protein
MLGIYRKHRHPSNSTSLWTVNDVCSCAETVAPLFTHALIAGGRRSTVSLEATEYPWNQPGLPPVGEDTAVYQVRPSRRWLCSLAGCGPLIEPPRCGRDIPITGRVCGTGRVSEAVLRSGHRTGGAARSSALTCCSPTGVFQCQGIVRES